MYIYIYIYIYIWLLHLHKWLLSLDSSAWSGFILSLITSSQVTFQASSSLANLEAKMIDKLNNDSRCYYFQYLGFCAPSCDLWSQKKKYRLHCKWCKSYQQASKCVLFTFFGDFMGLTHPALERTWSQILHFQAGSWTQESNIVSFLRCHFNLSDKYTRTRFLSLDIISYSLCINTTLSICVCVCICIYRYTHTVSLFLSLMKELTAATCVINGYYSHNAKLFVWIEHSGIQ